MFLFGIQVEVDANCMSTVFNWSKSLNYFLS